MYLITGCGRSGTTYTATYLEACGHGQCHERNGNYGYVGWYIGMDLPLPQYSTVLHQYRHPIDTISSCFSISERSDNIVRDKLQVDTSDRLHLYMQYWYFWNLHIQKYAKYSYAIEDFSKGGTTYRRVCKMLGVVADVSLLPKKTTNTRPHKYVCWDELYATDSLLAHLIKNLSENYGYGEYNG